MSCLISADCSRGDVFFFIFCSSFFGYNSNIWRFLGFPVICKKKTRITLGRGIRVRLSISVCFAKIYAFRLLAGRYQCIRDLFASFADTQMCIYPCGQLEILWIYGLGINQRRNFFKTGMRCHRSYPPKNRSCIFLRCSAILPLALEIARGVI